MVGDFYFRGIIKLLRRIRGDVTMQKLKYDETQGNNVAAGNSKFVQFT